jgi:hypothetical protein
MISGDEEMSLTDAITKILSSAARPLSPQEIREVIKNGYPEFYGTESHIRNVKQGYYKNMDHALLAQIYTAVRSHKHFFFDNNSKPIKVSYRLNESLKRREGAGLRHQNKRRLSSLGNGATFEEKIRDILENYKKYHDAYYQAETFRGPSL